jgi:hypothetical protein
MPASSISPFNPVWLLVVLSVASAILSVYNLALIRRNKRSDLEHSFVQQRDAINLAFATHNVRSPFAERLQIPDEELREFSGRIGLFFLQINHLNDAYQHRTMLPSGHMVAYESWLKNILGPWILSHRHTAEALRVIYETNDIMPPDFVQWLKDRLRAHR